MKTPKNMQKFSISTFYHTERESKWKKTPIYNNLENSVRILYRAYTSLLI